MNRPRGGFPDRSGSSHKAAIPVEMMVIVALVALDWLVVLAEQPAQTIVFLGFDGWWWVALTCEVGGSPYETTV